MDKDTADGVAGVIWLAIFGTLAIIVVIAGMVALPFVLPGVAAAIGAYAYVHSDGYKEKKAREHTYALYEEVKAKFGRAGTRDEFLDEVDCYLPLNLPIEVRSSLFGVALTLYNLEGFSTLREPPTVCNSVEGARYRDYLSAIATKDDPHATEIAAKCTGRALMCIADRVPEWQAGGFTIQLTDLVAFDGDDIEEFIDSFYTEEAKTLGLFKELRAVFDENLEEVEVLPSQYRGDELLLTYFKNTPFLDLFNIMVPFGLPENTRFEHHWIVAPPGTGKSTTIQHMLTMDFDRVARGEASVIVMESNRDLIKAIERLDRFAPGGDLEGRLTLIDCEDVEHTIALNLFDINIDTEGASARDREALFNSAISMLDYVFRALLGAELTSRQSTLFNFTITLLLEIPDATLDTLIVLMQPNGIEPYREHLEKLDADTRSFFDIKFNSSEFARTKEQVVDRLFAVKRIRTLSRMFAAPKTKLNLFEEMGQGKVILINTPRELLQEEGVEIVGRFFLAMILLAAEKRQLLPQSQRMPTYVYIDECQDVIRRDEKLPTILDQARKFRVAMILAHQRLGQMQPPVLNALYGSTAIKFATRVQDNTLARYMNTDAEFIRSQPTYSFAAYVSGTTDKAVSLSIPHVDMTKLPRMSDEQYDEIVAEMRRRYSYTPEPPEEEDPEPEPPTPEYKGRFVKEE